MDRYLGGLPKSFLQPCLLLLLKEEPGYGYDLVTRLKALGIDDESAAVYRALRTLEEKGAVYSYWNTSSAGPARRMYRLTPAGEEQLQASVEALAACAVDMAARFGAGGRLLTFGNGGSSTDAADVAQLFLQPRIGRALPAFCLGSGVAVLTALSNDVGFDVVYARQVAVFGRPGDMVFGISTSGGSHNVLRASRTPADGGSSRRGGAGHRHRLRRARVRA
jgi:phosphoheptose isomerase